MDWLSQLLGLIFWILPLLLAIVALIIIPEQQKKAFAHAWLLLVLVFPPVGWLLYLLIGNPKLSKKRRAEQRHMDEMIAKRVASAQESPELQSLVMPAVPSRYQGLVRLNARLGGMPVWGGNDIELFSDYMSTIQRIVERIDGAQRYVHAEYFMFADDETGRHVVDALIRAQQRGVKTRVLVDYMSNMEFSKELFKRLGEGGVEAHHILPFSVFKGQWSRPDLRNHRKNLIIDGEIGFTGSQNMINNTYNKPATIKRGIYYEDVATEVRGPIVGQLAAVFATDWYSETGQILEAQTFPELAFTPKAGGTMLAQVVPSGPGHETENNLALFIALVHHAQQKAVIITPYFVPDNALLAAIQIAALRGVNVILIVSGVADQFLVSRAQRSYYQELLNAGVEIRLVEEPVLLHAKNMSIDDDVAVIGSSNMDMRSFELTLEISLVLYDAGAVTKMRAVEALYMGRSTPLKPEEWLNRPFSQRFVENLTRLMSPLV